MVGLEVAFAVITGVLSRAIDYTDNLLSDRYTHHASLRVMEQASRLDLTTYENPVYYDRLERARVQATDRLAMIQQMGRLFQQGGHHAGVYGHAALYYSPWLMLLLAAGIPCHPFSARPISRFWAMPRTSAKQPPSGRWTICAKLLAAAKVPKKSSCSGSVRSSSKSLRNCRIVFI